MFDPERYSLAEKASDDPEWAFVTPPASDNFGFKVPETCGDPSTHGPHLFSYADQQQAGPDRVIRFQVDNAHCSGVMNLPTLQSIEEFLNE